MRNELEPPEATWNESEQSRTSWNHLERDGTSSKLTKKNATLPIAIVTKSSILGVGKVSRIGLAL